MTQLSEKVSQSGISAYFAQAPDRICELGCLKWELVTTLLMNLHFFNILQVFIWNKHKMPDFLIFSRKRHDFIRINSVAEKIAVWFSKLLAHQLHRLPNVNIFFDHVDSHGLTLVVVTRSKQIFVQ